MRLNLDNCCFNRPFDDQTQLRIKLEAEAKLKIQEENRSGSLQLAWSYILDYENSKNPFQERNIRISRWKKYAINHIEETNEILELAVSLNLKGIQKIDSSHISCAIHAESDYFLTTDDKVLKAHAVIEDIRIADPISFIKEGLP